MDEIREMTGAEPWELGPGCEGGGGGGVVPGVARLCSVLATGCLSILTGPLPGGIWRVVGKKGHI